MLSRPGGPCRRQWITGTRESLSLAPLENHELYIVGTLLNWDVQIASQSNRGPRSEQDGSINRKT